MTTPTGVISLFDVAAELGRGAPIALQDADVRALADVPSGPISLNDCRGATRLVLTIGRYLGSSFASSWMGWIGNLGDGYWGGPTNNTSGGISAGAIGGVSLSGFSAAWDRQGSADVGKHPISIRFNGARPALSHMVMDGVKYPLVAVDGLTYRTNGTSIIISNYALGQQKTIYLK